MSTFVARSRLTNNSVGLMIKNICCIYADYIGGISLSVDLISAEQLEKLAGTLEKSGYGVYLKRIIRAV